jgi:hypothetical protein
MVEISLYGFGEGLGRATGRGYSTGQPPAQADDCTTTGLRDLPSSLRQLPRLGQPEGLASAGQADFLSSSISIYMRSSEPCGGEVEQTQPRLCFSQTIAGLFKLSTAPWGQVGKAGALGSSFDQVPPGLSELSPSPRRRRGL